MIVFIALIVFALIGIGGLTQLATAGSPADIDKLRTARWAVAILGALSVIIGIMRWSKGDSAALVLGTMDGLLAAAVFYACSAHLWYAAELDADAPVAFDTESGVEPSAQS